MWHVVITFTDLYTTPLLLSCYAVHSYTIPSQRLNYAFSPRLNRILGKKTNNRMKNCLLSFHDHYTLVSHLCCHLEIPLYTSSPLILLLPLRAIASVFLLKLLYILILVFFYFTEGTKGIRRNTPKLSSQYPLIDLYMIP